MTESERSLMLDMAFFAGEWTFLGMQLRPLSLMSYKAMQMMQIQVLDDRVALTPDEEIGQIAAFLWLHTASTSDVCAGMWNGSWRNMLQGIEVSAVVITEWRVWRARLMAMLEASAINVRPRPPGKSETPADVVGPSKFSFMVGMIARFANVTPEHAKWDLFMPEALQYFHTACRMEGMWTVRPGQQLTEEDVEDLLPDFLKGMPGFDSASTEVNEPQAI